MMNVSKLFLSFLFLLLASSVAFAQEPVVVDKVIAVVGKNIIKLSDLESAMVKSRGLSPSELQSQRCDMLEGQLLTKLLIHKGQMDSTEVSDEEVENQVQYYLKNLIRQYGSKEAIEREVGYSFEKLHDVYFDLLYDRNLSQMVEHNLTSSVTITPSEVQEYFAQMPKDSVTLLDAEYELSEIVLQPVISQQERDEAKLQLNQLRERILAGERFATLATLYSQDPGSAKKGGELGFFSRGDMVSEFEAAAFALKPGEVSPIVETQYGFHILQLVERRGNTVNVRHILLAPKVNPEDLLATRIRLDSIADQVRAGNISFEEAARKFSSQPSRTQGGKLSNPYTGNNRFAKDALLELFPGISISNMRVGDISNATAMTSDDNKDIFRIIRLDKKIEEHQANLTDDYDKIYSAALAEAKHKKMLSWAQKMIKNTYVYIAPEYHDCSFRLKWFND